MKDLTTAKSETFCVGVYVYTLIKLKLVKMQLKIIIARGVT